MAKKNQEKGPAMFEIAVRICTALGLPGKQGFDGSQAWNAVRDGRVNEVIEYNCGDVERLHSVFRKLTFAPRLLRSRHENALLGEARRQHRELSP